MLVLFFNIKHVYSLSFFDLLPILTYVAYPFFYSLLSFSSLEICILSKCRREKTKEQLDPNQAAAGLNPAYVGGYGATPPVSDMKYSILVCD